MTVARRLAIAPVLAYQRVISSWEREFLLLNV